MLNLSFRVMTQRDVEAQAQAPLPRRFKGEDRTLGPCYCLVGLPAALMRSSNRCARQAGAVQARLDESAADNRNATGTQYGPAIGRRSANSRSPRGD
jgi:hypothetical protein